MKGRNLTVRENNFIQVHYGRLSTGQIAQELGRSRTSIKDAMNRMGLKPSGMRPTILSLAGLKQQGICDYEITIDGVFMERYRNWKMFKENTILSMLHKKYENQISTCESFKIIKIVASNFPPITEDELADAGKPIMKVVEQVEPLKPQRAAPAIYSNKTPYGIAK